MQQLKDKNIGNDKFFLQRFKMEDLIASLLFVFALLFCLIFSVICQLHTQDIHATLELERFLDNELRFLGDVSHHRLGGGIDILHNHLHLFSDCLDLNTIRNRGKS